MAAKTKEFQLAEETTFKNEIIHFFNIDAMNGTINIYLEIDGKKAKSEKSKINFHKLILKDIGMKSTKKEINFFIVEDVELKILIRIINKYKTFFRRKSRSFHLNVQEQNVNRTRKNSEKKIIKSGMSIKDKIKLFSGEFIKRQNNNKVLPGRLIMPKIFQNDTKLEKKEKGLEEKIVKKNIDNLKEEDCKKE
jgi:hypothetical protein